jgi:DNA repair exonuclease SbcCD nuclease subunit
MGMVRINKPKVCVISDLHLGVHTNSAVWHEIAINWANWLAKELSRKNIKDIIFCGDWHHNRSEISVNTLQVSADILDILKDFNIIAITGNHDLYYKHRTDVNSLSIYKGRKNITIFDNPYTLEAFDRTITLCPWNTNPADIPNSDIIFGHFEIETFKMNSYKVCEEGIKIKDLLQKASIIISGHFHTRHEKTFGSGTILYCGNPFQMDFGDLDNTKGYYILDLDTLEYEFNENVISPQYKKIHLSELVQLGTIDSSVRAIFTNNIVKLKIDKNITQEDIDVLINKLTQLKPLNLTLDYDINFNKIGAERLEKDLSGIDIPAAIEEFVNLLDTQNKKEILSYTLELYNKCIA